MIRFSILRFPLLRTLPGKLFVLSSIPLVVLLVVREFVELPAVVEGFRKILSLAFLVSVVAIAVSLVRHQRHRMLWRVRHKLLVSYLLLGFVPLTLILGVVLFGSIVLYTDISAYVFQTGMGAIQDAAHRSAEIVAQEIGGGPAGTKLALDREYARRVFQFPEISMAVVPVARGPGAEHDDHRRPVALGGGAAVRPLLDCDGARLSRVRRDDAREHRRGPRHPHRPGRRAHAGRQQLRRRGPADRSEGPGRRARADRHAHRRPLADGAGRRCDSRVPPHRRVDSL